MKKNFFFTQPTIYDTSVSYEEIINKAKFHNFAQCFLVIDMIVSTRLLMHGIAARDFHKTAWNARFCFNTRVVYQFATRKRVRAPVCVSYHATRRFVCPAVWMHVDVLTLVTMTSFSTRRARHLKNPFSGISVMFIRDYCCKPLRKPANYFRTWQYFLTG